MTTDSIEIHKTWNDKNGDNLLTVKVNALCNPDQPPFDGHPTKIEVWLNNENHNSYFIYDEEDYQMCMILFYENDIVFHEIEGAKAVFIPFFHCGNLDTENTVFYIVLYNDKKYLFPLTFNCNENGYCHYNNGLERIENEELPIKIKEEFRRIVNSKYKFIIDFYAGERPGFMEQTSVSTFDGREVVWFTDQESPIYSFRIRNGYPEEDVAYLNDFLESLELDWLYFHDSIVREQKGDLVFYLDFGLLNDEILSFYSSETWIVEGMMHYTLSGIGYTIDIANRQMIPLEDILSFEENFSEGLVKLVTQLYPDEILFDSAVIWENPVYYFTDKGLLVTTGRMVDIDYTIPYPIVKQHLNPNCTLKFLTVH